MSGAAPLPTLSLPAPRPLRIEGDTILDPVRGIRVSLTPEEWVRQHALQFLFDKGVPPGLIAVEKGHRSNAGPRRTDITVHDRSGSVWLVCECKAASVRLRQTALAQVLRYAAALKPAHVAVTNGLSLFVAVREGDGSHRFLPEFPIFSAPPSSEPNAR